MHMARYNKNRAPRRAAKHREDAKSNQYAGSTSASSSENTPKPADEHDQEHEEPFEAVHWISTPSSNTSGSSVIHFPANGHLQPYAIQLPDIFLRHNLTYNSDKVGVRHDCDQFSLFLII